MMAGRDQVIFWILQNQLGRRNLRSADRDLALARLVEIRTKGFGAPVGNKNAVRSSAKESDAENNVPKMGTLFSGEKKRKKAKRTIEKVAEETGCSKNTVQRAVEYKGALDVLGLDKPPVDEKGKVEPKKRTIERAKAKREGKPAPEYLPFHTPLTPVCPIFVAFLWLFLPHFLIEKKRCKTFLNDLG